MEVLKSKEAEMMENFNKDFDKLVLGIISRMEEGISHM